MNIALDLATPSHNPWHIAYELTDAGRERVMREIAPNIVEELVERHPDAASVSVSFDGVPYAGLVRT